MICRKVRGGVRSRADRRMVSVVSRAILFSLMLLVQQERRSRDSLLGVPS